MKIYIVLVEDRHDDVRIIPFSDKGIAITHARTLAKKYNHDPEDYEEEDIEGWLFFARYTCEGDSIRVIEAELQ